MEALMVKWIDRKGFSLTEFIAEPLEPIMARRYPLEPYAEPHGERSVQIKFQRESQEGNVLIYREVLE